MQLRVSHELDPDIDASARVAVAGRVGFAAKGVLYILIGALAINVALNGGGQPEDKSGALATVAEQPLGIVLLSAMLAGLGGYALWRLFEGIVWPRESDGVLAVLERVGAFVSTAFYGALCVLGVSLLVSGSRSGGGSGQTEDKATALVLDLPLGRAIVIGAGCVIGAIGLYKGWLAVTRGFNDELETDRMSEGERRFATGVGVLGHLARMIVFILIAIFLTKAAVEFDPDDAVGLDGALRELASTRHGPALLGATAFGLAAFGLFSLVQARYRRFCE